MCPDHLLIRFGLGGKIQRLERSIFNSSDRLTQTWGVQPHPSGRTKSTRYLIRGQGSNWGVGRHLKEPLVMIGAFGLQSCPTTLGTWRHSRFVIISRLKRCPHPPHPEFQTLIFRTMPSVPWSSHINFTSALLLHSCTTILLKETLNWLEIARRLLTRLLTRRRKSQQKSQTPGTTCATKTSAVLDAYTSIFSGDVDGLLAELYFTNTGVGLLAVSLASSVVMNLLLSSLALNMIVAGTFGLTFAASLAVGHAKYTLLFMALRRAGRFIWSDTPFVNFFTLIYIATVLKGQSTIRLRDYVTFRSIAVFESIFMKAKLASADHETQVSLMRNLIMTERVILRAVRPAGPPPIHSIPVADEAIGTEKSALVSEPADLISK